MWSGGPQATDVLIAVSRVNNEVFITDRLAHLKTEHLKECLILVGHCVWAQADLQEQIMNDDWLVVGSNDLIPTWLPASQRIQYVMDQAGVDLKRLVPPLPVES